MNEMLPCSTTLKNALHVVYATVVHHKHTMWGGIRIHVFEKVFKILKERLSIVGPDPDLRIDGSIRFEHR